MRRPKTRAKSQSRLPATPRSPESQPLVAVLYLLAFCSGVAALIYEITWAKMLALTFGSTAVSAAAVIAGFLGGMGIGARAYPLIQKRFDRPLVVYACLEVGIAISTAVLTLTFYSLPELFAQVSSFVPAGAWFAVVRFVAVFALLLLPAVLMGATFPALCAVLIHTARGVDRHLGMIYGINTFGGAVGAMLGGLVLVERFGLTASVRTGNVINIAVAAVAFAMLGTALARRQAPTVEAAHTAIPTSLPRWLTGLVLLVSGFTTLAYEILWFRALRFLVGSSTYALTTVLVIFLAGLGAGSLLLRRAAARPSPERTLALCQYAIAVLALWAMACQSLVLLHPAIGEHISIFTQTVRLQPWWLRLLIDAGSATVMMLPATLFMGLSFPLATRLFLGDVRRLGQGIGGAYLLANLGSILGSVLAVALLLPVFGTIGGTKFLALINAALGLAVLIGFRRQAIRSAWPTAITMATVAMFFLVLPCTMPLYGDAFKGQVVYAEDGALATVHVQQDRDDPDKKEMLVDGCSIGCGRGFEGNWMYRKQVVLAHLPMVLDSGIRHTLNIGLGSATTLYAVGRYSQLRTLDCVEINETVVRASHLFDESIILDDPRVNLIVDDAIHYLLRSDKAYDLIISDGKLDPFFSGNATLLCQEYYRFALSRLSDDGLFVQWIPLAMLSSDFRVNLRTLCSIFPHVEIFYFPAKSIFMIASRQPVFNRPGLNAEQARAAGTYAMMAPYGIDDKATLMARRVAGKEQLQKILGEGPVSTWDNLILDYAPFKASLSMRVRSKVENLRLLLAAERIPRSEATQPSRSIRDPIVVSTRLMRFAFAEYHAANLAGAISLIEQAVEANPQDRTATSALSWMRAEATKRSE